VIFTFLPDWKQYRRHDASCGANDIIKNATEELKRLSENCVSCNFTITGRRVYFNKRLLRGKCSLNDCTVLYFSDITWFRVSYCLFISLFTCINFVIPTHISLNFYSLFVVVCVSTYLFEMDYLYLPYLTFIIYFYLFICTYVYFYSYVFVLTFNIYLCLYTFICLFIHI
jgi:hypothetical protein